MRRTARRLLTIFLVVVGGWLVLLGLLWVGQRRLIYLPDRSLPAPPADVVVDRVETGDGVEHWVWSVPAEGPARARVLVFNGNAGHKAHRLPLARALAGEGMEVMLFDYRGYGDTRGSPSEAGLAADAVAVANLAFQTDLPVVYLGESLGAGVATGQAGRQAPSALVLRSPFPSLVDVARVHYPIVPAGLLLRDRYEVRDALARIEVPVLVILGTADSIVPPELSRTVFESAGDRSRLVEMNGLGHNDPQLSAGPELTTEIRSFLDDPP